MKRSNNFVSKKTAQSVLRALLTPADIKRLEFLRAVVLCGLPGSGKSTVGRLLTTIYGFERFSSDQIRVEDLYRGQEHRLGKQHEKVMASRFMVYEELGRRVARGLQQRKRVVVDGTHMDDKRLVVLGGILSQVPVEQVAFLILKPPEWIMRRRLIEESKEGAKEWWSIYRYWRRYMKEGKASFPTETSFPRIYQIHVRRYAIRTFDWVPEIKAVLWDLDGTLYKDVPELRELIDKKFVGAYSKAIKKSWQKARREFFDKYQKLGSRTKVLESVGLNGQEQVREFSRSIDFSKFLRKDRKLRRALRLLDQVRHFILTNAGREETKRKLEAIGLEEELFDKVMVTYETPHMKPDPKLFKWTARRIGLKPEQILAVGDREKAEILPAKQVGMRTCYVWGVSKEADVSVPTVYEVAGIFGKEV